MTCSDFTNLCPHLPLKSGCFDFLTRFHHWFLYMLLLLTCILYVTEWIHLSPGKCWPSIEITWLSLSSSHFHIQKLVQVGETLLYKILFYNFSGGVMKRDLRPLTSKQSSSLVSFYLLPLLMVWRLIDLPAVLLLQHLDIFQLLFVPFTHLLTFFIFLFFFMPSWN